MLALTTERFSGGLRLSVGEEIFTATLAVLGVTGFVAVAEVAGTAVVEGPDGPGAEAEDAAKDRLDRRPLDCLLLRVRRRMVAGRSEPAA